MKAAVVAPNAIGNLTLGEAPEPQADRVDAIVGVRAVSLNRGEVRRAETMDAGSQLGWDVSGVIEQAARDGSGPPVGTRVVGFSRALQGWAERVALPTRDLAPIPDGVSHEDAATLPVAGLTALYCLERCDRLLGARVLITGATGGVGYFACQLATMMGADAHGQVRRENQREMITATGATPVVTSSGAELESTYRAIIDGVGGEILSAAIPCLESGGRAILYGVSAAPEATLPSRHLMFTGNARVEGFHLYHESQTEPASAGLNRLCALIASSRLKTHIDRVDDWSNVGQTANDLITRNIQGKAVLTIPA